MKNLFAVNQAIGGDGANLVGGLGVDGVNLQVNLEVTYPIAKIITPVMAIVNKLIDELEQLIPGDQTVLAATLKTAAQAELVQLLSETPAAVAAVVAPAATPAP